MSPMKYLLLLALFCLAEESMSTRVKRRDASTATLKLPKVAEECQDAGGDPEKAACLCNSVNNKGLKPEEVKVECAKMRRVGFEMKLLAWSCAIHTELDSTVCKPMCASRATDCGTPATPDVEERLSDDMGNSDDKDQPADEQLEAVVVEKRTRALKHHDVLPDEDDEMEEEEMEEEEMWDENDDPIEHELPEEELEKKEKEILEEKDDPKEGLEDDEPEDDGKDDDGRGDEDGGNMGGKDGFVPFDKIAEEADKCMTIPEDSKNTKKATCVCDVANGAGLSSSDLSKRCKTMFRSMTKVAPPWACTVVTDGANSHCQPMFPWRAKRYREAEQPEVSSVVEETAGDEQNDLDDMLLD